MPVFKKNMDKQIYLSQPSTSVTMLTTALCIFLTGCIAYLVYRIRSKKCHKLPPALPGALPVIGHTHLLFTDSKGLWHLIQKLAYHSLENGGVISARFGTDRYYFISDPEDALTVANTCLQKHFAYDFAKSLLVQGLTTGSGEIHKRHRKLLNTGFTAYMIHGYLDVFNGQARKLVREMSSYINKGVFDPLPLMKDVALETSCLTTFGSDMKGTDFLQTYMLAITEMSHMFTQRFQKFYLQSEFSYKLLGYQKREETLMHNLNIMYDDVIKQKKDSLNLKNLDAVQEPPYKPFLNFLLEYAQDGLLTDKEIIEEANTNIAASFDTLLHTLINIINNNNNNKYTLLSKRVLDERNVDKYDVVKLVYTRAVIKESLRLIPTVPLIGRYIDKDVKLKNYTLQANSQCGILTLGMNHHSTWGPDAEQFKPERWLDPESVPVNTNCFGGFSLGKRNCIGSGYAMTLISVILVHMVREYQWTADINKLELKIDVTIKHETGHEISIQKRQTTLS